MSNNQTPVDLTSQIEARQQALARTWDTGRRGLLMIGTALLDFSETFRDRNAGILGDVFIAAAGAIERRLR